MTNMDDDAFFALLTRLEQEEPQPQADTDRVPYNVLKLGTAGDALLVPETRTSKGFTADLSTLPLGGLGPFDAPDFDHIKAELEKEYLLPTPHLPDSLLRQAQRHHERGPDWPSLLRVDPSPCRTDLVMTRDVINGHLDFWQWDESTLPFSSQTAKNSTSFHRQPTAPSDFVRGKATHLPFTPGGLDILVNNDLSTELTDLLKEDELLTTAPGFERGLTLDLHDCTEKKDEQMMDVRAFLAGDEDDLAFEFLDLKPVVDIINPDDEDDEVKAIPVTSSTTSDIDALLPQTVIPTKPNPPPQTPPHKEWAHVVDVNQPFPEFTKLVPELAHPFPFELDVFQKRAVAHLEQGESVFVAAHTSAGKTVVAEYAIALAQKHMTRAIYTSPIKALSNQKFRDFRDTFADVGILTGDVQINPEASCLVMTTEILRSMLYRGADLIRDVEFVVFDEVHYVNDIERGVVWEEVIIMLPAHVTLILLSATVPNTREFADWVGRTKKKDIYVISTPKRPVPLEHYIYVPPSDKDLYKIVDSEKKFDTIGWKKAQDASTGSKKDVTKTPAGGGGRGGAQPGRGGTPSRGGGGRGRGGGGGAGPARQIAQSAIRSSGSNTGGGYYARTQLATDRNTYTHLLPLLAKRNLLPVILFTFSKKKCEEYASALSSLDFTSGATEKSHIHTFIERCVSRLKGSDRELPQILRMRELLSRGIAVHHGGLLPIVKEMVEMLFTRGSVKVLFATETFAMGVNAPARCVVFSSIRKHDGRSFRELLPGEYTQMSGRAGRRGLDDTGLVIISCSDEVHDIPTLQKMILGQPTKLSSQFRLTYNMILNLLRVEALKVEEMIKRSFSENGAQKLLPEQQRLFSDKTELLERMPKVTCGICCGDIEGYYDTSVRIVGLGHALREKMFMTPVGVKACSPGRIVVVNNSFYKSLVGVIISSAVSRSAERMYTVFVVMEKREGGVGEESAPLPVTKVTVPATGKVDSCVLVLPWTDMAVITNLQIKIDADGILRNDAQTVSVMQATLVRIAQDIQAEGMIPELDASKIRDLDFQEKYQSRKSLVQSLSTFQCTHCPDLVLHYSQTHTHKLLQSQLSSLSHTLSDQNLELLPDYHSRVSVLKELGFVDAQGTVTIKGRVGCEINTGDELILTEMILDNFLSEFNVEECVALLSCFVFQEKSKVEVCVGPKLQEGMQKIREIAKSVTATQHLFHISSTPSLNFGLVEVVHAWAVGIPFKEITELTDVLEGSIVRTIVRLEETCREVQGVARLIGDAGLWKKMEGARESIRRDIVFAGSLYF
ncbi:antiviral helicase [Phlyctochytrium arcticum]|nr:antiviral helicase [Phlyctochytrium arcticum]